MNPLFARLTVLGFLGIATGIVINAVLLQDINNVQFAGQMKPDVVVEIGKPFARRSKISKPPIPPLRDDKPYVASLGKKRLEDKIRDVLNDDSASAHAGEARTTVRAVQERLSELGYFPGDVDGIAGPTTRAAVMAFEFDKGFVQTGLPDSAILQVLRGKSTTPRRGIQAQVLMKNGQELILALQKALNKLGYDTGTPDGIMGPLTAKRIRAFERDHKLDVTGRVSGRLVAAIHKAQGQPLVLASLTP